MYRALTIVPELLRAHDYARKSGSPDDLRRGCGGSMPTTGVLQWMFRDGTGIMRGEFGLFLCSRPGVQGVDTGVLTGMLRSCITQKMVRVGR